MSSFRLNRTKALAAIAIFIITVQAIMLYNIKVKNQSLESKESKKSELRFKMNKAHIPADDPDLVEYVRETFMIPPPPKDTPYNLTGKERNPSQGLVQSADTLLEFKNGTFVECGAHDGEHNSNTLWLERELGWTGLLIEPGPEAFAQLKSKNRRAWLANVCLSSQQYPEQMRLYQSPDYTSRNSLNINTGMGHKKDKYEEVQCIPFQTLLLATGITKIDLFSLDVEGYEFEILKGIPFDRIFIKIFIIEYFHIRGGSGELHKFMEDKSYKLYYNQTTTKDLIYYHTSILL